jgi:2-polyprenyl-6-methoxyphenol hydroxylase-like FAD-dependent oxidoreductase
MLQEQAIGLGAEVRRGCEVTGFTQDVDGVTVDLHVADGASTVRTRFLVSCDGAHSLVRKRAGIAFPERNGGSGLQARFRGMVRERAGRRRRGTHPPAALDRLRAASASLG